MPPSLQRRQTRARSLYSESIEDAKGPGDAYEEALLAAATNSDLIKIRELVKIEGVNFNCTDLMGRTPIQLAVENEDLELLDLLMPLTSDQNVMYALLDALDDRKEAVAVAIAKHSRFIELEQSFKQSNESSMKGSEETTRFSEDITPIIVASQNDLYEAVKLFLLRKYTIIPPHDLNCLCTECSRSYETDSFRFAHKRLNVYRALASESYISLNSDDPILDSFRLRQKLLLMGEKEKHFRAEYHALADQLSDYVVKLLDKVYGSDELDIILNKTGEAFDESYDVLARVKLAVKYEEKKFVAHPSCQMRVSDLFYSGFPKLQKANFLKKLLMMAVLMITYPLLASAYIVAPKSSKLRFMRAPVTKFIAQTFFFFVMLCLVFYSTIDVEAAVSQRLFISKDLNATGKFKLVNDTVDRYYVRSANMHVTHIMILIWVVGLIWQEVKELYNTGWREHFDSLLNWIDILMLTTYAASYILRIYTLIRINHGITYFTEFFEGNTTFYVINTLSPFHRLLLHEETLAKTHYYWINPDRFYWQQNDALIISEVLFAIANVMDFARITAILPAFEALGPLQISFGLMLKDIVRFMGLFVLVFLAFAIGLANLYWFYDYDTRTSVALATHNSTKAEQYFANIVDSLRSCFWSIFGMMDPTIPNVENYSLAEHDVIQIVGYIIYGIFMITCIIILFNLLIAMMTLSYERMEHDSDMEWKFARTELYFDYMSRGRTLPVPLNLIPTPKSVYYVIRWILCLDETPNAKKTAPINVREAVPHLNNNSSLAAIPEIPIESIEGNAEGMSTEITPHPVVPISESKVVPVDFTPKKRVIQRGSKISIHIVNVAYKVIIGRIVKRFINDDDGKKDDTQDDLENLRQDLFRLRRELGNALELRAIEIRQTRSEVKESKETFLKDLQLTKTTFLTDLKTTHRSVEQLVGIVAGLSTAQDSKFQQLIGLSETLKTSFNSFPSAIASMSSLSAPRVVETETTPQESAPRVVETETTPQEGGDPEF